MHCPPRAAAERSRPGVSGSEVTARSARRRHLAPMLDQVRYVQRSFWRIPQAAAFTFAFPVLIIVNLGAVFGDSTDPSFDDRLSSRQYYVSTIAAVSVLGSCYSQLAIGCRCGCSTASSSGCVPPRCRAGSTSSDCWHSVMISVAEVALIVGIGPLYGVPLPTHWCTIWSPCYSVRPVRRDRCRGRSLIRSRSGTGGGAFHSFPAGVRPGHLLADRLQRAEPHRRRAARPAVQPGVARAVRAAHRIRLAPDRRPARLGGRRLRRRIRRFRWDPRPE